jgi:hypothetical protein
MNADAAVDIGADRLEGAWRHVPVRREQQRQQQAANKDEIPTEGHAHHRFPMTTPCVRHQRRPAAFVPRSPGAGHGCQSEPGTVAKSCMETFGNNWQSRLWCSQGESWMNSPDIAEVAFARAWSVYLLIHSGIDENDARRASLLRFIRQRCEAGGTDTELLAVEGLKYLKTLEGLPED